MGRIEERYNEAMELKRNFDNNPNDLDLYSLYDIVIADVEDLEKMKSLSDEELEKLEEKYRKSKASFFKKIAEYGKEKGLPTREAEFEYWHYCVDLSNNQELLRIGETKKIQLKAYIKLSSEFMGNDIIRENYFKALEELVKYGMDEEIITGLKMPTEFEEYLSRKDGCIFYFNENILKNGKDVLFFRKMNEILEKYELRDKVKITHGYDLYTSERVGHSYSQLIADRILKIKTRILHAKLEDVIKYAENELFEICVIGLN